MALGNFVTAGSYSNIHNILYDHHAKLLMFELRVYSDDTCANLLLETRYDLRAPALVGWDVLFSAAAISETNNSNLLKQIYVYLKTRPEFANVTDV